MPNAPRRFAAILALAGFATLTACSGMHKEEPKADAPARERLALNGAQEVPPNSSGASGTSNIRIMPDQTITGTVKVKDMNATAAHIHEGARGQNGPVIVPLTKTGENSFAVPANARLTDSQYASYKTGDLYVNVHSAAYPGGEVRAQLNDR